MSIDAKSALCARQLAVLADKNRLAVLYALMKGNLTVSELNERVPIAQNLLSHHLRVLREAGFVKATREQRSQRYSLSPGVKVGEGKPSIDLKCCQITL